MKLTIKKDEYVILVLSDHSRNAKEVSRKLQAAFLFEEVFYIESRKIDYREINNIRDINLQIQCILNSVQGISFYAQLQNLKNVDEFIYFNLMITTLNIFSVLQKGNKNLSCSFMEEGIFSYGCTQCKISGIRKGSVCKIRSLLGKKILIESTSFFYCFYPEIYKGFFRPIAIPTLHQNEEFLSILNMIFPIDKKTMTYDKKYIMLTSVYDFEGGEPVGEFELAQKIAKIVGKDNLLIKLHPRDFRTIYEDAGFNVDRNSTYPWEVIQLSLDFSSKVLLTINSGGVMSISMLTEKSPSIFFLYPFCRIESNRALRELVKNIQALLSNSLLMKRLSHISVPARLEEILERGNINE